MNPREAAALIASAVGDRGGTWADVGAGDGTFTRALVQLLPPGSRVYAVDTDAKALRELEVWAARAKANVIPVVADFTRPFDLPGVGERTSLRPKSRGSSGENRRARATGRSRHPH